MGYWLEQFQALPQQKEIRASPDWQQAWRRVAQITHGIEKTDPRFKDINEIIDHMDNCFLQSDWLAFRIHLDQLKATLESPQ